MDPMRATGRVLVELLMEVPRPLQPVVDFGLAGLLILGPAIWGFLFARRWGWKAGAAVMLVAYFTALWIGISLFSLMSACRPEQHCGSGATGLEAAGELLQWAASAYAVSWFWHLIWLAPCAACVWAGHRLHRRRSTAAA
ncbi:MAG: hypothetical protein JSR98_00505 [Proteobacteria bacterium]|nr:hypothetical protein [Pseudomonadota bacterium]